MHPLKDSVPDLDGNLSKMGRICCVKFDNILDGIALMSGQLEVF